ncbi:hypothetical protein PVK06_007960 [Gossypium arboreum]|uniref:RNase H type-1 domain-containing protein n=1 Tax=Gossypium arboreum TaxID=29729 RepID=A0ABR0QIP7_GOSAR|nr:hypothetical protein PVK06_007960 [Gossypium arboreum]
MSLVGWDSICQPKWSGGLGMRQIRDQNIAFLLKLGYKLVSDDEALWVRVLKSKYGVNGFLPTSIEKANCSFLWKSLSKVWSLLHDNLIWTVGDGNRIRCRKDQWIPNVGPLIKYLPALANINTDCLLSDLVTGEGNWNLKFLQEWLPEEVIFQIMGIPPPHPTEGPDRLSWRHTSTRAFSVKSAYKMLKEDSWNSRDELWKTTVRRGLANDASCSICGHASENILHIIRDCTVAKEAKQASLDSRSISSDYTVLPLKELTSKDWIYLNAVGAVSRTSGRAAAGGVIWDSTGNWIMGYNRFIGNCSIFDAELWGILDGLKLIQWRGHDNVIIHSDSLEVVKAIHENDSKKPTSALLRRIHQILSQERQWIIRHIPREENKSVDYLAKIALGRGGFFT